MPSLELKVHSTKPGEGKLICRMVMKCWSFCALRFLWTFETCLFYFLSCLKSQSFPFAFSESPKWVHLRLWLTIFYLVLWIDFGKTGQITCQTRGLWLNWDLTIWNVGGKIFWTCVIHMSISDLNITKL